MNTEIINQIKLRTGLWAYKTLFLPRLKALWAHARLNEINHNGIMLNCPYCGQKATNQVVHRAQLEADFIGLFDDDEKRLGKIYLLDCKFLSAFASSIKLARRMILENLAKYSWIDYLRCDSCGLVYQNYSHKESSLHYYYGTLYRALYEDVDSDGEVIYGRSDSEFVGRKTVLMDYFFDIIRPGGDFKVLDIGCAEGISVKYLQEHGIDAHGIEPSRPMSDYARKVLGLQNVICGSYSKALFSEKSFDAILCHHVLEHVLDFDEFLNIICVHLKENGMLLLQVPCFDNLEIPSDYQHVLRGGHIYCFSEAFLLRLLEKKRFEIINVRKTPCDLSKLEVTSRAVGYKVSAWGDEPCGISILAKKCG